MAHTCSEKLLDVVALGKCKVPYTKSQFIAFALLLPYLKQGTSGHCLIKLDRGLELM